MIIRDAVSSVFERAELPRLPIERRDCGSSLRNEQRRVCRCEVALRCQIVERHNVMLDIEVGGLCAGFFRIDDSPRCRIEGVQKRAFKRPYAHCEMDLSVDQKRSASHRPDRDDSFAADDFSRRRSRDETPLERTGFCVEAVQSSVVRSEENLPFVHKRSKPYGPFREESPQLAAGFQVERRDRVVSR